MASLTSIITRIVTALQLYAPDWDISPGTPEFTMIEAFANELSGQANNSVLQTYSLDPNSMSGSLLDNFCAIFGIYRLQGTRSVGSVAFATGAISTSNIYIPLGTQVYYPNSNTNGSSVNTAFQTTTPAILIAGTLSVTVPVVATLTGTNGNVPAGAISGLSTAIAGITSVNNTYQTLGGSSPESDAQLRSRFEATVFRNLAGTSQQFLATVLDNAPITQATVVGPVSTYLELLQIYQNLTITATGGTYTFTYNGVTGAALAYNATAAEIQSNLEAITGIGTVAIGGTGPGYTIQYSNALVENVTIGTGSLTGGSATLVSQVASNIPDTKYTYPQGSEIISSPSSGVGAVFGVDYSYIWNSGTPPLVIQFTENSNSSNYSWLTPGSTVQLQSQYMAISSRNTPTTNPPVMNKVDVFAQGTIPQPISTQTIFNTANTFGSNNSNWKTMAGTAPNSVDIFTVLPVTPLIPNGLPSSITVGSSTYSLGIPGVQQYNCTITGATGGTFTITIGSQTTAPIPYNATASQIADAFLGLPTSLLANVTGGPLNTSAVNIQYPSSTSATFSFTGLTGGSGTASSVLMSYYQVTDTTTLHGSPSAQDGIAWVVTSPPIALPASGTLLLLSGANTYTYNSIVTSNNDLLQQVQLVGSDVLMHQTPLLPFIVNLVVTYTQGSSFSGVNSGIQSAMAQYFSSATFGNFISLADIYTTAMGVSGVGNVRIANSSDNAYYYGLQVLADDQVHVLTTTLYDYPLASNELPTLAYVNVYPRSQSTFFSS